MSYFIYLFIFARNFKCNVRLKCVQLYIKLKGRWKNWKSLNWMQFGHLLLEVEKSGRWIKKLTLCEDRGDPARGAAMRRDRETHSGSPFIMSWVTGKVREMWGLKFRLLETIFPQLEDEISISKAETVQQGGGWKAAAGGRVEREKKPHFLIYKSIE